MKRLLSFMLALSILLSLVPVAVAEGTGETVQCTLNPACILGDGHEAAECSVPEAKVCETGCTLESGHTGDCVVPEAKICETGCTLESGHTGDCVVPEAKICETGCTLEPGHTGDCVVPEAKICETGCILEEGHNGDCQTEQLSLTPAEGARDGVSSGLQFATVTEGTSDYSAKITVQKNQAVQRYLCFNGEKITNLNAIVYDPLLTVSVENGVWNITATKAGTYTIQYNDGAGGIGSVSVVCEAQRPGLWLEIDGTFYQNAPIYVGRNYVCAVYYNDEVVNSNVSFGYLNASKLNYGWEIRTNNSGGFPVSYDTGNGNMEYASVTASLDVSKPPQGFSSGLFFCTYSSNNGTNWTDRLTIKGEQGATLVLLRNGVATILTSATGLSVSGEEGGLTYQVYGDGVCIMNGVKPGTYQLTYTEGESTYSATVIYDDGLLDLTDFDLNPGLYHVIDDNGYFFDNRKNIAMQNGQGMTFGPLVVSRKNGDKFQLLAEHEKNLSISPSDGASLAFNSSNNSWVMTFTKADLYTITYTVSHNEKYTIPCTISNRGPLFAKVLLGTDAEGAPLWSGWQKALTVTEDEPTQVKFAWINPAGNYVETVGHVGGSNDQIVVTRDMNTKISTVLVDNPGVNANVTYAYDDYNTYMMPVNSVKAYRLALKAAGSSTPVYDYIGEIGKTTEVQFLFGQPGPTSGLTPFGGSLTVSDGIVLEGNNGTGAYKMTIQKEGKHTISFKHTCTQDCPNVCDIAGKTFTVNVEGIPESSGGSFFALQGSSSSPIFVTELMTLDSMRLRFCYGSYGDYKVLKTTDLTAVGDSVTLSQDEGDDAIRVTFAKSGQTLLQYKDGEDVVHNYVIKCYDTMQDWADGHYSEQGYNTVSLSYKGKTVSVGPAYVTPEKMTMWPGNSFNHTAAEDFDIYENVVIGAMYAGPGYSVLEPVDADFYRNISNMNTSLLYCENTVPNASGYNVTIEAPGTTTWEGRTLQSQKFQGKKGMYFEAELLISFDVKLGNETHRFYRPANLSYRGIPDDAAQVNITDAKVLNSLLSNSYALINYLEANVEGFTYGGGNLTLELPAVTYNDVLVSQVMLPGSTDVLAVFTIKGTGSGDSRTTVPGIYSKGFLYGVENINFVAQDGKTMSLPGNEPFTCGLLVNNNRTTFQPEFDAQTLQLYHPEFQGMSLAEVEAILAAGEYAPSVNTSGNSYNIGRVVNCSFTAFEYAMRTDMGGFVQGASGCTIRQCKFGVYINAGGVNTLHTDGRANTTWRNNEFIENWAAVRITGLPDDLSPYYIRFVDNNFYRNNKEFWVTARGHYYFYRNYYSGHWNAQYWQPFWKNENGNGNGNGNSGKALRMLSEGTGETARAANLDMAADTVLVTNPCRSVPGSNEKLWIFDDENQNTVILQSEADGLKVSADAISALGETLDIPVLNEKEDPVGIWTIYEGGDTQ